MAGILTQIKGLKYMIKLRIKWWLYISQILKPMFHLRTQAVTQHTNPDRSYGIQAYRMVITLIVQPSKFLKNLKHLYILVVYKPTLTLRMLNFLNQ